MTSASDAILSVINAARGERPYSMESQETEQTFNVALALIIELLATNDRVDRLERHIAEITGKPLQEVRATAQDETSELARNATNEATIMRVLRVLIDPRPKVDQRPTSRTKQQSG